MDAPPPPDARGDAPPGEPPKKADRRGLLAALTIDIGPLRRHRDYRLLYLGQLVSFLGTMMTTVALPYQIYALTRSSLSVGLLGLAELIPLLTTAFIGGALADALDRRKLLLFSEAGLTVCSALLVVNASLASPRIWPLYVLAALMAGLSGIHRPSLSSLTPRLVDREEIPAIGALSSLMGSVCMIGGPALGGLLIARGGARVAFAADVVSFGVSLAALAMIRRVPPPEKAERPGLASILGGLRYAWSRQELIGTYVVDFVAMIFGMPTALFPAMSERLGGATILGYLYAAPSVGALVATLTSGWTPRVKRHGVAVLWAAFGWGLSIIGFGFSPNLGVALLLLGVAGAADMVSGVFRQTIWNETIPDALRGRLAGVEMVSYMSGPLLGSVESGLVAAAFGTVASVASGGALCVLGVAACAWLLPGFRAYDARAVPLAAAPRPALEPPEQSA
jgi:MFS family permease